MKEIKDYLHLYGLGTEVMTPDGRGKVLSLHNKRVVVHLNAIMPGQVLIGGIHGGYEMHRVYLYDSVKPFLRLLPDMTEEEHKEALNERGCADEVNGNAEAYELKYYLSKHFDLFGLIESGLAIDKTLVVKN